MKKFIYAEINPTLNAAQEIADWEVYSAIKDAFGKKLDEYDVLIPALCTELYKEKAAHGKDSELLHRLKSFITARFDIKLMSTDGELQLLSVSDDNAKVVKPQWLQRNGSGYMITSYVGLLELVAKSSADGKISLNLRGRDIRDPDDKKIPYWIDYTKLTINEQTIFDKLTPAWHDKTYQHTIHAKADEEIKIQVEWLPHLDERTDLSAKPAQIQKFDTSSKPAQIQKFDTSSKPAQIQKSEASAKPAQTQKSDIPAKPAQIQKFDTSSKPAQTQKSEASAKPVQIQENNSALLVIDKFKNYLTARVDLTLMEGYTDDLQIFSISDDKVMIKKPAWLQKDGICYQIESYAGNMEIVAKAFADGQLIISLKGIWVPDPEDKSKRLRYWIDFTKCIVNGEVILDKITPVWNGKPYVYNKEVKAGEEIKINVEWQPHRGKA